MPHLHHDDPEDEEGRCPITSAICPGIILCQNCGTEKPNDNSKVATHYKVDYQLRVEVYLEKPKCHTQLPLSSNSIDNESSHKIS